MRSLEEIRRLRERHEPSEIVALMAGRMSRRTVYRILGRLRKEDAELAKQRAERTSQSIDYQLKLEALERRERIAAELVRRYENAPKISGRLRRVYS